MSGGRWKSPRAESRRKDVRVTHFQWLFVSLEGRKKVTRHASGVGMQCGSTFPSGLRLSGLRYAPDAGTGQSDKLRQRHRCRFPDSATWAQVPVRLFVRWRGP